jgi:GLPGLI family protein
MKKTALLLGILVSIIVTHLTFGQGTTTEGVITYEVKINLHRTLPPGHEDMKSMVPEFRTRKDELIFNAGESLYKPVIEEEEEDLENTDAPRMQIKTPQNEIYVKPVESKRILLNEFMGKKYLIEDSIKVEPWRIGTETKTIQGYLCRRATFHNEEQKQHVTVWFTDKMRPQLGPENFNTLPGAVLMVDVNEGERIITAVRIEARSLKKNELQAPKGGSKITESEFKKMMDEQMKKMRANGGNVIIRN